MYLRCNHDNCRRIDWRTVHGLQCHIVKNHEQPKGTIGSLEKALDRYGVPVSEVEEYEREHGEGTGGTMADPKNMKIKNKLREGGRKSAPGPAPGSWGLEPTARPAGYKPSPGPETGSGRMTIEKDMGDFVARRSAGYVEDVNSYSGANNSHPSSAPKSRFEAVRGDWHTSTPSRPPPPPLAVVLDANRQLQGDAVMQERDSPAPTRPQEPTAPAPEPRQWTTANFRPYTPSHATASKTSGVHPHGTSSAQSTPAPSTSQARPDESDPEHQQKVGLLEQQIRIPISVARGEEKAPPNLAGSQKAAEDTKMTGVAQENLASTAPDQNKPSESNSQAPAEDTQMTGLTENPPERPPVAHNNEKIGQLLDRRAEGTMDSLHMGAKKDSEAPSKQADLDRAAWGFKEPATPVEGPARGTRSAIQSPVIAHKPLNPPGSIKRNMRRASAARRPSGDGSTDGHPTAPSSNTGDFDGERGGGSTKGTDDGEGIDGESITVAAMKKYKDKDEDPKTPPRRNANGRFTRRRTGG